MYLPEHFAETDPEIMYGLIRANPLGLLISSSAEEVQANPVPFLLDVSSDGAATLKAHVARANQEWKHIRDGAQVLVVFQGANSYITPSWYATKQETGKVVPTWNYAMVQARGAAAVVSDPDWLGSQIDTLTETQEAGRKGRWHVSDAPERYIDVQMRGIVGIEIAVASLVGKWKVSQNRPEADRSGVHKGLIADDEADMAELVGRFVNR